MADASDSKPNASDSKPDRKLEDEDMDNEEAAHTEGVWDFCFVMDHITRPTHKGTDLPDDDHKVQKWKDLQTKRKEIVANLKSNRVGLKVGKRRSKDGTLAFILIAAPQERLEIQAETINLPMKLKEEYGGGFHAFSVENKTMFLAEDESEGFFRSMQRIYLIETILQGDPVYGGAGLKFYKMIHDGVITRWFPLPNEEKRKELVEIWANPKKVFKRQPLQLVRNYLGEEITLYFAWLGFYTQWLWYASIAGFITTPFWLVDRLTHAYPFASWATTIYAIYLSLWATFFLEYWKRYNNSLNYQWGMLDYKELETERADFKGETALGVYYQGTWVPLEDDQSKYNFQLPPKRKYYPTKIRRAKIVLSLPLVATMIITVVVATFAVLALRLFVQRINSLLGSIVGGALNAIVIMILNMVWNFIAVKLNDWENYRTETEYVNNLIFKVFSFYFVNSYTCMYFLAFAKNNFLFFGVSSLLDNCNFGQTVYNSISNGCPDEVSLQLVSALAVNMFVGQAQEVLLPWLQAKFEIIRLLRNEEVSKETLPVWERDNQKGDFQGTLNEYVEMVIQYGYITLFAATFPIAPIMAVLNNIVEIRTDAFKILSAFPRPRYRGAQNIGTWYYVLEFLGVTAVMTNVALIGLSFEVIRSDTGDNDFYTLGIVVFMEHVILILKFGIAYLIPDLPGWIVKKLAYEEYVKEETLKAILLKNHIRPVFEVASDDSEDEAMSPAAEPRLSDGVIAVPLTVDNTE
jgi:hypothetical protein